MNTNMIARPLLGLTANDLMSRDVVVLPQEMSLRAAAHTLAQNQISGAPVVDHEGRCIGIVSATDFVHLAKENERVARSATSESDYSCVWQVLDELIQTKDQVGALMTRDLVTVSPQASIVELARLMLDAHIHRVVVADERNRPIGIVSSTDLLAAIANSDPENMHSENRHSLPAKSADPHDSSGWRVGHKPRFAADFIED